MHTPHLIKRQFKEMDLDLQNIWNRQSNPDVVLTVLETISEAVFRKITDPSRETINVTQWCKRDACWKNIQGISIHLPPGFEVVLIDKTEIKTNEKEGKADQKLISGTEAQIKVLEFTADQWKRIYEFANSKSMMSPDESSAIKYACQIPEKLPSPYQSQKLLELLERMLSEGLRL